MAGSEFVTSSHAGWPAGLQPGRLPPAGWAGPGSASAARTPNRPEWSARNGERGWNSALPDRKAQLSANEMKAHLFPSGYRSKASLGSAPRDTIYYSIPGSCLLGKPTTPKFPESNQSGLECGCTPRSVCRF